VSEKNHVLSEWEKPRPQWVWKTTSSVSEKNHVLSEWQKPCPQWVWKTTSSVSEKNHVLSEWENHVLSEWEKPRPQWVRKTMSSVSDKNHVLSEWEKPEQPKVWVNPRLVSDWGRVRRIVSLVAQTESLKLWEAEFQLRSQEGGSGGLQWAEELRLWKAETGRNCWVGTMCV
jgi:hypothetical protein